MAEITFGTSSAANLFGSGLGFYGSTFGSSVQIGAYQSKTFITDSTGTTNGGSAYNIKYGNHPATGISEIVVTGVPLVRINAGYRTLDIHFDHTSNVNVQNCQFRVYDRTNVNYPASGVNTKVAELINFSGQTYTAWDPGSGGSFGNANTITCHGSGDLFWWGEAWPSADVAVSYYQNSVGTKFYNGTTASAATNGDVRLSTVTGADDTVGGTGLIVPLVDSPGSGGRYLNNQYQAGAQKLAPKWKQYYIPGTTRDVPNIGTAGLSDSTYTTYGGTGIDRRHTWRVAISATPLSIGSKDQYGAYLSLEYL